MVIKTYLLHMLDIGNIKHLVLEGIKEKAVEEFIRNTIKGTEWEGKVFIAGGYVRDEFMGKDPKDLDLLVNAPNGGIEFAKWITRKVGAYRGGKTEEDPGSNPVIFSRFGTAKFNLRHIVYNGIDLSDMDIEAVMPRKEQYAVGSRKPVVTGGELKDDVERRDFTVNSLLKDLSTGDILDLTGMGKADIKAGIIRTPLDPNKIFTDDPLRMLRAIRFAVKYDWSLPLFMIKGLRNNASQLKNISQERIRDELNKMLVTSNSQKAIKMLKLTGLLEFVIPELLPAIKMMQNIHHKYDVFNHTLDVLSKTQPILLQRLMALFHDIGKTVTKTTTPTGVHFYGHEDVGADIANKIMRRLKYPSDLIHAVTLGVKNHMRLKSGGNDSIKLSDKALRKFKFELGSNLEDLLDVIHADNISHSDASSMPNQIEKIRQRLKAMDIKTDKPKLPINGKDLIAMGIPEGKMVGEILKAITELWLENPNITKEDAIHVARQMVGGKYPLKEVYKGGIPRYLYHATFYNLLYPISQNGLKPGGGKFRAYPWAERGVYLTPSKDLAISFAETAEGDNEGTYDDFEEEFGKIVVLTIDLYKIDNKKLFEKDPQWNISGWKNAKSFVYKRTIPPAAIVNVEDASGNKIPL